MRRSQFRIAALILAMCCRFVGVCFGETPDASPASSFQVIYAFQGTPDAGLPGALTPDGQGNFYGVAGGGTYSSGSIFELKHTTDGWKEEVIYSFTGNQGDAAALTGLTPDGAGNFYALSGGSSSSTAYVFKFAHNGHGGWTKSVVYTFDDGYGYGVQTNLVIDSKGDIYGILSDEGRDRVGIVFELIPQGNGKWEKVTLHKFAGKPDGAVPTSAVVDSAGNVWGMTTGGGTHRCRYNPEDPGCGIAYELTPGSGGKWTETLVYDFARGGGAVVNPSDGFLLESNGNIIATSFAGGDGQGTVFELTRSQDGWEQKVLHRFAGFPECFDAMGPLEMNSAGALVGACSRGGGKGYGAVYELIPTKTGEWTEKILYSFTGRSDGSGPQTGVVIDSHGVMYGTAFEGGNPGCGSYGCGTVFELLPNEQ